MKSNLLILCIAAIGMVGCGKKQEPEKLRYVLGTVVAFGNGMIWVQPETGPEYSCNVDGPAHWQDYVVPSVTIAGDCHDTGIVNPNFRGGHR